jgi:hypothetical protein
VSVKFLMGMMIGLTALPCDSPAASNGHWTVQFMGGASYAFNLPLEIRQAGEDTIRLNADYDTDSFKMPLYWVVRAGWWRDNAGLELEFIHDKLYLHNGPPEVRQFSLSHGYNLLTLNRAWNLQWFILRIGAGVVFPHPESTVRDKEFDEKSGMLDTGYYLAGPVGQVALEKRFFLYRGLFASLEGKWSGSWAHVPINDGHADLWNTSIHGLVGLGYEF